MKIVERIINDGFVRKLCVLWQVDFGIGILIIMFHPLGMNQMYLSLKLIAYEAIVNTTANILCIVRY